MIRESLSQGLQFVPDKNSHHQYQYFAYGQIKEFVIHTKFHVSHSTQCKGKQFILRVVHTQQRINLLYL